MLKIPTNDNYRALKITLAIIVLIFTVVMIYLATIQYTTIQLEKETAIKSAEIKQQIENKAAADREIKFNTDVNRLVSICQEAAERYNQLSAIEKTKTHPVNCELSPR